MRWAISGGAGFLGLHLARRLLADGHEVRTLDLAPLDEPELERRVEELRGDIRNARDARAWSRARTCSSTRRRRCRSRPRASRSARPTSAARRPCSRPRPRRAWGGRARLVDRGLRHPEGASDPRGRPARRRRLVRRVEDRGGGGDPRLRPARARLRDHPAEDVHRAGAARRLRDPLRLDPRRPPDLHARRRARTATSCWRSRISSTRSSSPPSGRRRPARR